MSRQINNALNPLAGNFIQKDKTGKSVFDEKDNKNKVIVEFIGDNNGNYLVNKVVSSAMDNKSFRDELKDTEKPLILNSKGSINQKAINMAAQKAMGENANLQEYENGKGFSLDSGFNKERDTVSLQSNGLRNNKQFAESLPEESTTRISENGKYEFNGGYDAMKKSGRSRSSHSVGTKRKTIRQRKPNRRSRRYL
jgi:hypothetical protein